MNILKRDRNRHMTINGSKLSGQECIFMICSQFFFETFSIDVFQIFINRLNVSIFCNQLHGSFFSNTTHTRDIIRRITHQPQHFNHLLRSTTKFFSNSRNPYPLVTVIQHYYFICYQLHVIFVTGYHHTFYFSFPTKPHQGTDNIICFKSWQNQIWQIKCLNQPW